MATSERDQREMSPMNNRKRSRLSDEEGCEFMPISKRINKLHIRSGQLNSDEEGQEECLGQGESTRVNGCDITDGPSHSGTNGFLQANGQGHEAGLADLFGNRCPLSPDAAAAIRLSSNANGCSSDIDRVRHHQVEHHHHQQQQQQQQQQMNGTCSSSMNAPSSSSTLMYNHLNGHHDDQNGVDQMMDHGSNAGARHHPHHLQQQQQQQHGLERRRCEHGGVEASTSSASQDQHDSLESQFQALSQMHQQMQESQVANYDPTLTPSQNPFYYEVNEMLYRLHVLRMQRIAKTGV